MNYDDDGDDDDDDNYSTDDDDDNGDDDIIIIIIIIKWTAIRYQRNHHSAFRKMTLYYTRVLYTDVETNEKPTDGEFMESPGQTT